MKYKHDMKKENVAAMIIDLETEALERWNSGDPDGYLALYAEDITYFDPFQEKRFDGFDKMKSFYGSLRGQVCIDRYEMIDPVVQVSGTMAVLTYNLYSYEGENVYKWNCTEVYRLERSGQWKIIHNHWSFIRPDV